MPTSTCSPLAPFSLPSAGSETEPPSSKATLRSFSSWFFCGARASCTMRTVVIPTGPDKPGFYLHRWRWQRSSLQSQLRFCASPCPTRHYSNVSWKTLVLATRQSVGLCWCDDTCLSKNSAFTLSFLPAAAALVSGLAAGLALRNSCSRL